MDLAIASPPRSPAESASTHEAGAGPDFAVLALKAQAAALAQERFQPAAMAFVTEVALSLGCDRVSLGVVEGGLIQVVAVSHGGETEFAGTIGGDIAHGDPAKGPKTLNKAMQDYAGAKDAPELAHPTD